MPELHDSTGLAGTGHAPASEPVTAGAGDLAAVRPADDASELAEAAVRTSTPAWAWLPAGPEVAQVGRRVARSLVKAGFSLYRCDGYDLLYRLGGVCMLPVTAEPGGQPAGVTISWTTHHLLALDQSKRVTSTAIAGEMNKTLGVVLRTLGYNPEPFGAGGAWIIAIPASDDREAASDD